MKVRTGDMFECSILGVVLKDHRTYLVLEPEDRDGMVLCLVTSQTRDPLVYTISLKFLAESTEKVWPK
jgi:hypothetical protein